MEPAERLSLEPIDSPFGDPPEAPRLGIIHLMVGTALVACYFSFDSLLMMFETHEMTTWLQGYRMVYGLGAGLAIGGPLLFVARRSRGMRFPIHPGETLWILLGVTSVLSAAHSAVVSFVLLDESGVLNDRSYFLFQGLGVAHCMLVGILCLMAARWTRIRRWRRFLYAKVACYVIYPLFSCAGSYAGQHWLFLFPTVVLAAVVLTDVLRRARYPWSHWSGVAIQLWLCCLSVCSAVYYTFFWESGL